MRKNAYVNLSVIYKSIVLCVFMGVCQANETDNCAGVWLSKNYYDSIKEYKSPRNAQSNSQYVVIPEWPVSKVGMVYNFHEGADEPIRSLVKISENEIELNNVRFIKISAYSKILTRQPFVVGGLIFEGEYSMPDGAIVRFNIDGTITGLGDNKFYYVQLDYYDVAMDIDMLALGVTANIADFSQSNRLEWLGFKFDKEYLKLFKTKCEEYLDKECVRIGYGDVIYTLKRMDK